MRTISPRAKERREGWKVHLGGQTSPNLIRPRRPVLKAPTGAQLRLAAKLIALGIQPARGRL